jgi:hypothetical protein
VRKLDKKTLMADKSIAGFQKLSIIHLPGTTAVHECSTYAKGLPKSRRQRPCTTGDASHIALSILVLGNVGPGIEPTWEPCFAALPVDDVRFENARK